MQRVYTIFSAILLSAFVLTIALKMDSDIVQLETSSLEEVDLEDCEDKEKEETEIQWKDITQFLSETTELHHYPTFYGNYHFAIKASSRPVSSPPPEA